MAPSSYHTSLLTATDCRSHVHLIIGSNSLAGKRCEQSLANGATPILITPDPDSASCTSSPSIQPLHYGLTKLIEANQVTWRRQRFTEDLLFSLGREEIGQVVDAVFLTTTNAAALGAAAAEDEGKPPQARTAAELSALCKRHRIPINVVDSPSLCTFSLLSTHTDGPLQIGITTNGRGCHLASRIRREVVAVLPPNLGAGCARLGEVRRRVQEEDHLVLHASASEEGMDNQAATFNRLVTEEDLDAAKSRRMRWLAQVCEYWPLKRLAAISDEDVETVLKSYPGSTPAVGRGGGGDPNGAAAPKRGRLILAGSGPGHPDLLTRATYKAILSADLILADKLVPSGVLDLIPRRTPVSIARKYPGNAEQAQEELYAQSLAGVRAGKTVLRLKQGDPFVYGRGGEEVAHFRARGLGDRVVVLPGITSALSAPLFAGVPPTQRDVADQVLVCTGTGKKGKPPAPPECVAGRTCVFLMALHRISGLVAELTRYTAEEELGRAPETSNTNGADIPRSRLDVSQTDAGTLEKDTGAPAAPVPTRALWPLTTPCAVIERASCPDQRVLRTTLQFVAEAIDQEGSRPPGLLVVGRACEALYTPERGRAWAVEEGFRGMDIEDDGVGAAVASMAALS